MEKLRKKHGYTLSSLAKESGVSKSVLSDIKTGIKTTLNHDQEIKLSRAFKIEIDDLYGDDVKW